MRLGKLRELLADAGRKLLDAFLEGSIYLYLAENPSALEWAYDEIRPRRRRL